MPEYIDIEMKLREILVELELTSEITEVKSETNIRHDLGLDEFQIIELTGAAEEEYGININTDEAELSQTIGEFVELIQRNLTK